jgi:hypothetical protein
LVSHLDWQLAASGELVVLPPVPPAFDEDGEPPTLSSELQAITAKETESAIPHIPTIFFIIVAFLVMNLKGKHTLVAAYTQNREQPRSQDPFGSILLGDPAIEVAI